MKLSINRYLVVLFLLLACVSMTRAQVMHVTGSVYKQMKSFDGGKTNKVPLSVPVYIFDNRNEANKQAAIYRSKSKDFSQEVTIRSNATVTPDYDGHFEADVSAKGALMVINEGEVKVVDIGSSLQYDIVFTGGTKTVLLANTIVTAKHVGANIVEMKPIDDGPNLHWDVTVKLPEWYTKDHSRLIFQPIVINCEEEDTIQYLEPLVFEGKKFHKNQIRRKSFDYNRNDSLHNYFIEDQPTTNDAFAFRWEATYPKPNPNKSYKWGSVLRLEDYTHVYFEDKSKNGTCNTRKPWKLLDVSMAMKQIKLTPQYYEQARAQLREVPRDLQLTFVVGKDELTSDESNQQHLEQLVKELRSYGRALMNFTVQGTASPEGNVASNTKLANTRARKALSIIGGQISSAGLEVKEPLVYTWFDVADSLKARSLETESNTLRNYAFNNNANGLREMQALPVVQEILQNQRLMRCTYTLRQNKVLDPQEALWTYYNDKDYQKGGKSVFSNGDYYNLFTQIKDSVELRKLTYRAWNEIKTRRTMQYSPFAAYVANRVACYAIESDSIDLSILAPFVDMKAGLEISRPISFDNEYRYTVNRREIIANQAIMYFKTMKLGEAYHLANKLPNTDEYKDIKMFTDLETLFFKQGKTADEDRRAKEALSYVMTSNAENYAILNFELASELGKTYEELEPLIDSLPDNSAKKWYMKGVIEAGKPEMSDDDFMALTTKYGADVALRMTDNTTPAFLAYFQHCFDMKPQYKGLYNSDANIPDDIRKRNPYDEKKAEQYRQKFTDLMIAAGKMEVPDSYTETSEEGSDSNAQTTNLPTEEVKE